jgi:microcystin-dependent protein
LTVSFSGGTVSMSEPFLGELRCVGFNFAPIGWLQCNGQILSISQYSALFSLLGTTYGGNGTTNFALPNLQGRVPAHVGGPSNYVQGEILGVDNVSLTTAQIPSHTHAVNADAAPGTQPGPMGNYPATDGAGVTAEYSAASSGQMNAHMIALTGGGQPHENRQPTLVLNWIISMQGIYPSRS